MTDEPPSDSVPACPTCGHTMAVHHPDGRCGQCVDIDRMKWGHRE